MRYMIHIRQAHKTIFGRGPLDGRACVEFLGGKGCSVTRRFGDRLLAFGRQEWPPVWMQDEARS